MKRQREGNQGKDASFSLSTGLVSFSFAFPGQRTGLTGTASQVSGCPPGFKPPQCPMVIFGWHCPTTATSNLPPRKPRPPPGETLLLFKGTEEGSWKAANSASTGAWLKQFPPQLHIRALAPGTGAQTPGRPEK